MASALVASIQTFPAFLAHTDLTECDVQNLRSLRQVCLRPSVTTGQLAFVEMNQNLQARQRKVLRRVQHWSANRVPPPTRQHRTAVICG